jgi:hypothetical protein
VLVCFRKSGNRFSDEKHTQSKLLGKGRSLLEALAQKEEGDFEFDPPRMGNDISRPADFD